MRRAQADLVVGTIVWPVSTEAHYVVPFLELQTRSAGPLWRPLQRKQGQWLHELAWSELS